MISTPEKSHDCGKMFTIEALLGEEHFAGCRMFAKCNVGSQNSALSRIINSQIILPGCKRQLKSNQNLKFWVNFTFGRNITFA
jgi:hypothetical protein